MRLGTGTAGTAEAGVILIATELGLQDELTVGQLRLIHAIPARVPRLGGQCCKTTRGKERVRKLLTISFLKSDTVAVRFPQNAVALTFQHLYVQLQEGSQFPPFLFFFFNYS